MDIETRDEIGGLPCDAVLDALDAIRGDMVAWISSQRWALLMVSPSGKPEMLVGDNGAAVAMSVANGFAAESTGIGFTVCGEHYDGCMLELTNSGTRLQRDLFLRPRTSRRRS